MKCQFITPIFLLGILNVLSCIPPLVLAEENKELSKRGGLRGGLRTEDNRREEVKTRAHKFHERFDIVKNNRHLRSLNELFEGDIVPDYNTILEDYGPDVVEELIEDGILDPLPDDDGLVYNSVMDRRWSIRVDDVVHVPYDLDSDYTPSAITSIRSNIKELGDRIQVVKFVPRTSETDYILVKPIRGCSSNVGKQGGEQRVSLTGYCIYNKGVTQHEFLHALGLFHEQSRPDRDNYVMINDENIRDGKEHNFEKKTISQTLGNEYDYGSVMHYPTNAFSKNGQDTIVPIRPLENKIIGQRTEADDQDIIDIRLLYQCISGPRSLSDYNTDHCTDDCKCWKDEIGCNGNNNACQGSLICSINRCIDGNNNGNGNGNGNGNNNGNGNGNGTGEIGIGLPKSTKMMRIKNLCLSVNKNKDNNVTVWGCNNLGLYQKWIYNDQTQKFQSLMKGANLCLEWDYWKKKNNKNNVSAKQCVDGKWNQKWFLDTTLEKSKFMIREYGPKGKCLTMTWSKADGNNIVLEDQCTFKVNQRFSFQ